MSKEFYKQRNQNTIVKLRILMGELPAFCREFFLGIEQRTSSLTRLGYAYDLRIFFDFLSKETAMFHGKKTIQYELSDLEKVTPTDLELFLQYLSYYEFQGKTYTNDENAKARKLSTVKTMYRYFFKKDKIAANTAEKVELPKLHHKEIIRLEENEVENLLNEVDSGSELTKREQAYHVHTKKRDLALITLLLGTGMRISECVGLNVEDIDFNTNSVKIIRKGGGESILYISQEVSDALSDYLYSEYGEKYRVKNDFLKGVPLFKSMKKNRLSVRAVQVLVKKYAGKVTPLKHITPHKLRSTYGTSLYRQTKDIYIVADVLGHKDVNTTKKHYAAISDDIRRQAAGKVVLRHNSSDKENTQGKDDE